MSIPVVAFGPRDSYYIESPNASGMNDLPPNLQGHFAPPSPVSLVYFMFLGANDSFFMTYRGVDGNDYMVHEGLPRSLDQWLSDKDENDYCTRNIPQITFSLGPNGKSFFVTDGIEMGWSGLPKNLEEALETLRNPNGSWMTLPRYISLGAHQSFVLLNHDNSGAWDLQSQYPYLQLHFDKLKASATNNGLRIFHNINAIYLNPFEAGYFVLTTTKGEAAWSVPKVARDDASKVLSTLARPDSPSMSSTTTSSTPPPSASIAQLQPVTKIARAELQRISSGSIMPSVQPTTPPLSSQIPGFSSLQSQATPPTQPSPPRSHPQPQSQPHLPLQSNQRLATRQSKELQHVRQQSPESIAMPKKPSAPDPSLQDQKQPPRDTRSGQQEPPKAQQHSRQRTSSREVDAQIDAATVRILANRKQLLADAKIKLAQMEVEKAAQAQSGQSTPDLSGTGGLVNKFEGLTRPANSAATGSDSGAAEQSLRHQENASPPSQAVGNESRRYYKTVDAASNAAPPPPPPPPPPPASPPSKPEESEQENDSSPPAPSAPHRTFTNESVQSDVRQSFASNDSSKFVAISRHSHPRQPSDPRITSSIPSVIHSGSSTQGDRMKPLPKRAPDPDPRMNTWRPTYD